MPPRAALLLFVAAVSPACIIALEGVNVDCQWTHDLPARLDNERHLSRDVAVAEELAIRYAARSLRVLVRTRSSVGSAL
jgi:hypothetical protein